MRLPVVGSVYFLSVVVGAVCLAHHGAIAFVPAHAGFVRAYYESAGCSRGPSECRSLAPLDMSSVTLESEESCVLSDEEVAPLMRFEKGGKEKVVNAFGLWGVAVTLLTCPIWALAMTIVDAICKSNEELDPHRSVYDATGKVWSKVWLTMANSYPTITGDLDRLREGQGACLYVANHASWLDIPVLCTVLDPVFKFISKAELIKVPCIGQQLTGVSLLLCGSFEDAPLDSADNPMREFVQ